MDRIDYEKPPLGVTPNYIWIHQRKSELARAIYEYIQFSYSRPNNNFQPLLRLWISELSELVGPDARLIHLQTCGTAFRGCDPNCPKDLAEKADVSQQNTID